MLITHVLANGTIKNDISDHLVKADENIDFYETLKKINRRLSNEQKQDEN